MEEGNCEKIIEEFIEQIKNNANEISANNKNALAMSLARSSSIKNGRKLSSKEMNTLVDQLFACENPYHSPNGKPIIIKINEEDKLSVISVQYCILNCSEVYIHYTPKGH